MGIWVRAGGVLLAGCTVVAAGVGSTPAASAKPDAPRYASPIGQASSTCPKAEPCDIVTAINAASAGAEVVIEPGTYGSAAPLSTSLTNSNSDLYVHGQAGKPRPDIVSAAPTQGLSLGSGSRLSDLKVNYSGTSPQQLGIAILLIGGSADHVFALATTGINNIACDVTVSLTDSTCISTADNGEAIQSSSIDDINQRVRGVTAEATGANGVGLEIGGTEAPQIVATVTNSIIHGAGADVAELTPNPDQTEAVTLDHSDYSTIYPTVPGTGESITGNATDIAAPPKFLDAAADKFSERPTSPTVNKGAADPSGDTDLAGNPRTLGAAPDMGAYELAEKPLSGKPKVRATAASSATLTVTVNPEGLPTKVHLVGVHGHLTITSKTISAGNGRRSKAVKLTIHGLRHHEKYVVYAEARNSAGIVKSDRVTLTTPEH